MRTVGRNFMQGRHVDWYFQRKRITDLIIRGYFIVRYVAVQSAQALGILLNPARDWEQCQDPY
jgi:hypothetical protein